jgi:hypothetical protein
MVKLLKSILGISLLAAGIMSCSDIIETDIGDETPVILGPASGDIEYGTLTFWWTEVDGATQYRLQIISPSFDRAERLYLDTLVTKAQFNFTPAVGKYQWRVQAVNSAYSSQFSEIRDLTILEGTDLTRVELVLKSPADDLFTNSASIDFSWVPVAIATQYKFELLSGSTPLVDTMISASAFSHSFTKDEKAYLWRVTAYNDSTHTAPSARRMTFDFTAPGEPSLTQPKKDSLVDFSASPTVDLRWVRKGQDVAYDSLYLYDDATNDEITGFSALKMINPVMSIKNTPPVFKKGKKYRWTVRSFDRAGNESDVADNTFIVNVE